MALQARAIQDLQTKLAEVIMKNPIQPIHEVNGVIRFKENKIVRALLDYSTKHGCGMNELAMLGFSNDDRRQFAQLIGYSLSGFGSLSYVDEETYSAACAMHEKGKTETQARIEYLEELFTDLKRSLREPISALYEIHPDDLVDKW